MTASLMLKRLFDWKVRGIRWVEIIGVVLVASMIFSVYHRQGRRGPRERPHRRAEPRHRREPPAGPPAARRDFPSGTAEPSGGPVARSRPGTGRRAPSGDRGQELPELKPAHAPVAGACSGARRSRRRHDAGRAAVSVHDHRTRFPPSRPGPAPGAGFDRGAEPVAVAALFSSGIWWIEHAFERARADGRPEEDTRVRIFVITCVFSLVFICLAIGAAHAALFANRGGPSRPTIPTP
jgi:hypothetical protein